MNAVTKPNVLFVDDYPEEHQSEIAVGLKGKAEYEVLHPQAVDLKCLTRADLVLVDARLENWTERDAQSSIALQPSTGMALAVLLREHLDLKEKAQLTAFALHTGHLDQIRGRIPAASAPNVVARLNNLEWVFSKTETRRFEKMLILANAVRALPSEWPECEEESKAKLQSLLAMSEDETWFDRCWREVQDSHPPMHELRTKGHGLMSLRWLLHRVLPYPCFLSEEHWVAARLQIPLNELNEVLRDDNQLKKELELMRYSGILAEFLGPRWWRGALEDFVWSIVDGQADGALALRNGLEEKAKRSFTTIEAFPPVVCLGSDFQPSGQFCTPMKAVRLRPDHWPAYADIAWIAMATVREHPDLASMVDPRDQARLLEYSEE